MATILHLLSRCLWTVIVSFLCISCGKEPVTVIIPPVTTNPPAIQISNITIVSTTNFYFGKAEALSSQADLILWYEGVDMLSRHKPLPPDGKPLYISGTNALSRIIPGTNECARNMAFLIFPATWIIGTNFPILEEVALDLDDSLRAQGFQRIVHSVSYHGMLHELFTNGMPSRAEVQQIKQSNMRVAEEFQRTQTTNKSNLK
jgi:hypothetical protein